MTHSYLGYFIFGTIQNENGLKWTVLMEDRLLKVDSLRKWMIKMTKLNGLLKKGYSTGSPFS